MASAQHRRRFRCIHEGHGYWLCLAIIGQIHGLWREESASSGGAPGGPASGDSDQSQRDQSFEVDHQWQGTGPEKNDFCWELSGLVFCTYVSVQKETWITVVLYSVMMFLWTWCLYVLVFFWSSMSLELLDMLTPGWLGSIER